MRSGYLMLLIGVAAALLPALTGCAKSDGIPRVPLSGSVTFQGEPVADGQVRFIPKPGTTAPLTIATISNGRYDTAGSGGVPVGQHRVEIRAYDPGTAAPKGPDDPRRKQLLPAKYNVQSTLELVVNAEQGGLKQDFNLLP